MSDPGLPEDSPPTAGSAEAARKVIDYIQKNPGKFLLHIVNILAILTPGVISGPLLWLLGFGSLGPRAASIASLLQTPFTAAGSLFTKLQSAAMGGYGAAIVKAITQIGGITGALTKPVKALMRKMFGESA